MTGCAHCPVPRGRRCASGEVPALCRLAPGGDPVARRHILAVSGIPGPPRVSAPPDRESVRGPGNTRPFPSELPEAPSWRPQGGPEVEPGVAPPPRASIPTLADEEAHAKAYDGAVNCPHRRDEVGCCGPFTRCGPGGVHEGRAVGIAICYPCTIGRLGLAPAGENA